MFSRPRILNCGVNLVICGVRLDEAPIDGCGGSILRSVGSSPSGANCQNVVNGVASRRSIDGMYSPVRSANLSARSVQISPKVAALSASKRPPLQELAVQPANVDEDLVIRVSSLTKRCSEVELLLEEELSRSAALVKELGERDRLIAALRNENHQLTAQLADRERHAAESRQEADNLAEAVVEKDRLVTKLCSELQQLTEQPSADQLLSEVSQRDRIKQLEGEVQTANESVRVCVAEFERACASSDALRNELTENAKVLAFYRKVITERDAELDSMRARLVGSMTVESPGGDAFRYLHSQSAMLEGEGRNTRTLIMGRSLQETDDLENVYKAREFEAIRIQANSSMIHDDPATDFWDTSVNLDDFDG